MKSIKSMESIQSIFPAIAANAVPLSWWTPRGLCNSLAALNSA